jgi:hypothetical protein
MDPVSARSTVPTDTILAQTMEGVGDHDPTNIQKDTGKPLHFDATTSADVRRAGLTSNGKAIEDAKTEAAGQLRDKVTERAIDAAADLAGKYGPAISGMGMIAGSVVQLGSLYNSAIEKAKQEGDTQRALGASDAGVVALSQTLNFSASFKSSVAVAHNGSSNVAAAMTASLNSNPATQSELQFRADKGFVDAAGYAKMAAKEMKPLIDDAKSKLAASKTADPATAATLRSQANDLMLKAAEAEKKYMAPVQKQAAGDAAYGLGVQYAVHCAVAGSSDSLDKAFAKANANVSSITPTSLTIPG